MLQHIYAHCRNDAHRSLTKRYTDLTSCEYKFVDSYEQFRDKTPDKILILGEPEQLNAIRDLVVSSIPSLAEEAHLIRGQFFVEVLNPQANKQLALEALCKETGVSGFWAVVIGDVVVIHDHGGEFLF